jgi:hypothetical protein
LAGAGETERAGRRFRRTFDLLFEAHGTDALRRFERGTARGRVLLAAYECIAIGVARNLPRIRRLDDPVAYVRRRIEQFWAADEIENFFVAGLRGTARIQRTIPFGQRWFAE